MSAIEHSINRLAIRERPSTGPVMLQNWENLLFLHWQIDPSLIRSLVPNELEIDTFDDQAWIGVTPFAMSGVRFNHLPAIPGLSSLLELNVRTYVHHDGVPGVYFFSLDASKAIPVIAARVLYAAPYFKADMHFARDGSAFDFRSKRFDASAEFSARWTVGKHLGEATLDSLEFFLVERYGFFVKDGGKLNLVRIHHRPWELEEATVLSHRSTMISRLGIRQPDAPPLAHFSRFLNVEIWEPRAA
ncbi:MAG TPA: DUF2071 domain-containing protein [Verrucomicrobiae bacterium]|nr:DUF2071 domain-containing protein [Verrucomicrobiae bacterium]